jgi:Putative prokaryotic signal transducing protein
MTMVERAAALPDPNERLVRVFATEQESEALVVRGLLESAGIDCQIGESENSPDVLPLGGVGILVREEDAERARQLIAESQRSPAQEQEEEADFDEAALEAAGDNDVSEESQ